MQLSGSSALVTGAASGLGAATAALLASRGVHVVGFDLPASVASPVFSPPAGVKLVGGDVTSEDDVLAALASVEAAHPLRLVHAPEHQHHRHDVGQPWRATQRQHVDDQRQ